MVRYSLCWCRLLRAGQACVSALLRLDRKRPGHSRSVKCAAEKGSPQVAARGCKAGGDRPHPYQDCPGAALVLAEWRRPAHGRRKSTRGCPLGTVRVRPMWHAGGAAGEFDDGSCLAAAVSACAMVRAVLGGRRLLGRALRARDSHLLVLQSPAPWCSGRLMVRIDLGSWRASTIHSSTWTERSSTT